MGKWKDKGKRRTVVNLESSRRDNYISNYGYYPSNNEGEDEQGYYDGEPLKEDPQHNSPTDNSHADGAVGERQDVVDTEVVNFLAEIEAITAPDDEPVASDDLPLPDVAPSRDHDSDGGDMSGASREHMTLTEPTSLWHQCMDDTTQCPYYWNISTNEVTWTIPPEFTTYLSLYQHFEEKVADLTRRCVKFEIIYAENSQNSKLTASSDKSASQRGKKHKSDKKHKSKSKKDKTKENSVTEFSVAVQNVTAEKVKLSEPKTSLQLLQVGYDDSDSEEEEAAQPTVAAATLAPGRVGNERLVEEEEGADMDSDDIDLALEMALEIKTKKTSETWVRQAGNVDVRMPGENSRLKQSTLSKLKKLKTVIGIPLPQQAADSSTFDIPLPVRPPADLALNTFEIPLPELTPDFSDAPVARLPRDTKDPETDIPSLRETSVEGLHPTGFDIPDELDESEIQNVSELTTEISAKPTITESEAIFESIHPEISEQDSNEKESSIPEKLPPKLETIGNLPIHFDSDKSPIPEITTNFSSDNKSIHASESLPPELEAFKQSPPVPDIESQTDSDESHAMTNNQKDPTDVKMIDLSDDFLELKTEDAMPDLFLQANTCQPECSDSCVSPDVVNDVETESETCDVRSDCFVISMETESSVSASTNNEWKSSSDTATQADDATSFFLQSDIEVSKSLEKIDVHTSSGSESPKGEILVSVSSERPVDMISYTGEQSNDTLLSLSPVVTLSASHSSLPPSPADPSLPYTDVPKPPEEETHLLESLQGQQHSSETEPLELEIDVPLLPVELLLSTPEHQSQEQPSPETKPVDLELEVAAFMDEIETMTYIRERALKEQEDEKSGELLDDGCDEDCVAVRDAGSAAVGRLKDEEKSAETKLKGDRDKVENELDDKRLRKKKKKKRTKKDEFERRERTISGGSELDEDVGEGVGSNHAESSDKTRGDESDIDDEARARVDVSMVKRGDVDLVEAKDLRGRESMETDFVGSCRDVDAPSVVEESRNDAVDYVTNVNRGRVEAKMTKDRSKKKSKIRRLKKDSGGEISKEVIMSCAPGEGGEELFIGPVMREQNEETEPECITNETANTHSEDSTEKTESPVDSGINGADEVDNSGEGTIQASDVENVDVARDDQVIDDDSAGGKRKLSEDDVEGSDKRQRVEDVTTEEYQQYMDYPTMSAEEMNRVMDEISDLSSTVLDKLAFLEVGKAGLTSLQTLLISIETRLEDWQNGGLETQYFLMKLTDASSQLTQYEALAAPPGWTCQWHREHRRYYYANEVSGESQWEYPEDKPPLSKKRTKTESTVSVTTTMSESIDGYQINPEERGRDEAGDQSGCKNIDAQQTSYDTLTPNYSDIYPGQPVPPGVDVSFSACLLAPPPPPPPDEDDDENPRGIVSGETGTPLERGDSLLLNYYGNFNAAYTADTHPDINIHASDVDGSQKTEAWRQSRLDNPTEAPTISYNDMSVPQATHVSQTSLVDLSTLKRSSHDGSTIDAVQTTSEPSFLTKPPPPPPDVLTVDSAGFHTDCLSQGTTKSAQKDKKKKKDKLLQISGSSISFMKKNVTTLVKRWKQIKEEVEREEGNEAMDVNF